MRLTLSCIAALALLVLFAAPRASLADPERELARAINEFRVAGGLDRLRREPRLTQAARQTAKRIARTGSLDFPPNYIMDLLTARQYPVDAVRPLVGTAEDAEAMLRYWRADSDVSARLRYTDEWEIGIGWADGTADPYGELPKNIWVVYLAKPVKQVRRGWREELLSRVNRFRAQNGLKPVTLNKRLNKAAQSHADDMAVRDYFAHNSPEGRHPGNRANDFGYDYQIVLENLAMGYGAPEKVVEGWKSSTQGHREAMIDPRVNEVGIGYRYIPNDKGKIRAHHYWAMTLGKTRTSQ